MLHLTYSNRLEVLTAPLAARVQQAQREDPLQPVTIIVPNRAVEQFVRFRVAEQLGVAANLRFSLMRGFLGELCTGADRGVRILDKDALHLLLFGRLRDPDFLLDEGLEAVEAYLGVAAEPAERDVRAVQLAAELARLFEEYSFSRRDLLRAWRHGPTLGGTEYARAERWQRRLWHALFDARGRARITPVAPSLAPSAGQMALFAAPARTHRWMMLIDAVFALRHRMRLPGAIHVFGLSYVAPAFAEVFAVLAERTEVCVYALNPCLEFWEDVQGARFETLLGARARSEWARRGAAEGAGEAPGAADEPLEDRLDDPDDPLLASEDPFGLDVAGDTPALRLWGRPGREFIRLLGELTRCEFAAGFIDPAPDPDRTLLQQIQRDILVRAPEPAQVTGHAPAPDDSIRFLATPNIRREVEIVADLIWGLMHRDDRLGDPEAPLRFHQIAVMVTDRDREAYLTHIESIFRERHRLPFNIIDRNLAGQSRVVEAVERLLDLPTSDFGVEAMSDVLTHPAIGGARAESLDRWREWIAALNVVFGADRTDLAETYIDRDVYNWDQALRRLTLGVFMTGARSGDDRAYHAEIGDWLPHETAPDAMIDAGRLVALVRGLVADARAVAEAEMSLTDWAIYLTRLVTTYVRTDRVTDEVALNQCLGQLEKLQAADLEGQVVGFEVAREMARMGLRALEGRRGQHQADGVVVSSLLPMRAIPFEVVFVLGLGEGQFPANARQNPLDLRRVRRRAGDVLPPERDRYLFLETVLAARQRLFFSYVARDEATGEGLEPSPVMRELQYILRGYISEAGLKQLTRRYPLTDYDPAAAEIDTDLTTEPLAPIGREAREAARIRALREHLSTHTGGALPELSQLRRALDPQTDEALSRVLAVADGTRTEAAPSEQEALRLPLMAVQRFLESPLQGWARYVLGLSGDRTGEVAGLEAEADEPLSMPRHARFTLLREAFWAGDDPEALVAAYDRGFEQRTLQGQVPVGVFGEVRRERDRALLETWAGNLNPFGLPARSQWRRVRLGRGVEFAEIDDALPPIRLDVPLASGRRRAVELHGTLLMLTPDRRTSLRCLGTMAPAEKHFLPGFLTAAALSAAGMPPGEMVRSLVTCGTAQAPMKLERRYFVPPPRVARDWFTSVVAELLDGRHDYRLPIEAVLRWKADRARFPDARLWWPPREITSDHYGPIRSHEELPVPDDREAYAMVDRRFGIWFYAGRAAHARV